MTEVVPTPLGPLDANTFYRERDSRMVLDGFAPTQEFPVAVAIPPSMVTLPEGQMAMIWLCSMLRRSGRAFARTILLVPPEVETLPYLGALHRIPGAELTLLAVLQAELLGADPFGRIELRPTTVESLADVRMVIWIGEKAELGVHELACEEILIGASGWVANIYLGREAILRARRSPYGAAAAAVAFAATLAVSEVHRAALGGSSSLKGGRLWVRLDNGMVTTEPVMGERWFTRRASSSVPWTVGRRGRPKVRNLLLISAGGLGLNFARILAESFFSLEMAIVVEPDQVDISNLNRLLGTGFTEIGRAKAELAAASLSRVANQCEEAISTYEDWSISGLNAKFLSAFDAVVVGVDQAVTRLEVAADWPALLVNGATAGRNWTASVHRPGLNGCLGCFYGSARQSYDEIHRVARCAGAGGAAEGSAAPALDASYPHVSVAAAATMVAMLIHAAWEAAKGRAGARAGERRQMQMAAPQFGATQVQQRVETCRLLCSSDYVRPVLEQRAVEIAEELGQRPTGTVVPEVKSNDGSRKK